MGQVEVRPLTKAEVKRFESAEENENKIPNTYGRYEEHDSIQKGMWIMNSGQYANSRLD
ncbi:MULTISPECIES: hypothetical protein [Vibrionaceae]|nr:MULTISPECIES: hypothetical protein [Vibrionaceae]